MEQFNGQHISFLSTDRFRTCKGCGGGHITSGDMDLIGGDVKLGDWVLLMSDGTVEVLKPQRL